MRVLLVALASALVAGCAVDGADVDETSYEEEETASESSAWTMTELAAFRYEYTQNRRIAGLSTYYCKRESGESTRAGSCSAVQLRTDSRGCDQLRYGKVFSNLTWRALTAWNTVSCR